MGLKMPALTLIAVSSLAFGAAALADDKPPAPVDAMRFTGRVEAAATVGLSARVAGVVDKVNGDIGDRVKKGQVLIELSAPELKDDLDAAAARLEQAKAEVERAEAVVEDAAARATGDLPRVKAGVKIARAGVEVAEAGVRQAQTRLGFLRIVAPFDGVVSRRAAEVGEAVGPPKPGESAPLLTVMREDVVRVVFDVDERSAARVAVGAPAVIHAPALADAEFKGKVTRTAGTFNPDTGTLRAEVDLPNPKGQWRPGMFVTVDVTEEGPGK